jgi:hypothetical protein
MLDDKIRGGIAAHGKRLKAEGSSRPQGQIIDGG